MISTLDAMLADARSHLQAEGTPSPARIEENPGRLATIADCIDVRPTHPIVHLGAYV